MSEQWIGARRARDMRFLSYVKRLAVIARRDREDTESAALVLILLEEYRRGVALRGCTIEDFLRTAAATQPDGSLLDPLPEEIPDEVTPAETPRALEWEARARGTWREWVRDLTGWRL